MSQSIDIQAQEAQERLKVVMERTGASLDRTLRDYYRHSARVGNSGQLQVLRDLIDYAGEYSSTGYMTMVLPSLETIGRNTGLSKRAISGHLEALRDEHGEIAYIESKGRVSHRIVLLLPHLDDEPRTYDTRTLSAEKAPPRLHQAGVNPRKRTAATVAAVPAPAPVVTPVVEVEPVEEALFDVPAPAKKTRTKTTKTAPESKEPTATYKIQQWYLTCFHKNHGTDVLPPEWNKKVKMFNANIKSSLVPDKNDPETLDRKRVAVKAVEELAAKRDNPPLWYSTAFTRLLTAEIDTINGRSVTTPSSRFTKPAAPRAGAGGLDDWSDEA